MLSCPSLALAVYVEHNHDHYVEHPDDYNSSTVAKDDSDTPSRPAKMKEKNNYKKIHVSLKFYILAHSRVGTKI